MDRKMSHKYHLLVGTKSTKATTTDEEILNSLDSAYDFLIDYPDLMQLWDSVSDERVKENFKKKVEDFNNMMLDAQETAYTLYHDLMKKLGA